jgi:hypothetical protein
VKGGAGFLFFFAGVANSVVAGSGGPECGSL